MISERCLVLPSDFAVGYFNSVISRLETIGASRKEEKDH
jgi:hypothetical protein